MESFFSWTHILFFAAWLGANLFILVIFLPASASLPPDARLQARCQAARTLNRLVVVSAPLVVLSGFAWLTLPDLSDGSGRWESHGFVMASKLTLTGVIIMNHLLQAFRYAPKPARDSALAGVASDRSQTAWTIWVRLLAVNVVLGLAVFLLGLSLV